MYTEFLLVSYLDSKKIDVYKRNGKLLEQMLITQTKDAAAIATVDHLLFPRLEWSDRYIDFVFQGKRDLPRKIIVAGRSESGDSYVAFYDRAKELITAFQILASAKINAIKFGPYDNGHVVVALDGGVLTVLSAISLNVVFRRQILPDISDITFDPTNNIALTSPRGEVAALSLV